MSSTATIADRQDHGVQEEREAVGRAARPPARRRASAPAASSHTEASAPERPASDSAAEGARCPLGVKAWASSVTTPGQRHERGRNRPAGGRASRSSPAPPRPASRPARARPRPSLRPEPPACARWTWRTSASTDGSIRRVKIGLDHAHHDQSATSGSSTAVSRGDRSSRPWFSSFVSRRRTRAAPSRACRPPPGSRRSDGHRRRSVGLKPRRRAGSGTRRRSRSGRAGRPRTASRSAKNTAKTGIDLPQAAEVGDLPRVAALVEHADQEEERARREAVVQHLVDRARSRRRRSARTCPSMTKPEVRHRRVGDELLESGCTSATSAP